MKALILVDIQNDFCPGGKLPVPEGNQVVPIANGVMDSFEIVVATQDWHGPKHGSFAISHPGKAIGDVVDLNGVQQRLWPAHCVQGHRGAQLHPDLRTDRIDATFKKGTDDGVDSYSGFFDNNRAGDTGLADWLHNQDVQTVYVMGLATDYCVKFTALDAVDLGFETFLIADGCRGVNVRPGDDRKAVDAMKAAGVKMTTSEEVNQQFGINR